VELKYVLQGDPKIRINAGIHDHHHLAGS